MHWEGVKNYSAVLMGIKKISQNIYISFPLFVTKPSEKIWSDIKIRIYVV